MTAKPRSSSDDKTRALRAGRREAILNAAAARMDHGTWVKFASAVRLAMESAETDAEASDNLQSLLTAALDGIKNGQPDQPPVDVREALDAYPIRKAGRPKHKKPAA